MSDCVFCKIVSGDIPATLLGETGKSLAFRDITPRAPLHILVIPKNHHANVSELSQNDPDGLVDLMQLGSRLASELTTGHFRFTFNTGEKAGQTVFHAHGHITSTEPVSA